MAIPVVILKIAIVATILGAAVFFARRDRRAGSFVTLTGALALLLFFVMGATHPQIVVAAVALIWGGGALTPG